MLRRSWIAPLLAAATVAGCGDDGVSFPAVSYVAVVPLDTLAAPGDTVRIVATPFGLGGEPVQVPLTYEVDRGTVGVVDSAGVFVALGEGTATVTVTEEGGVRGFSTVRVVPVTRVSPRHASFGAVVTVDGWRLGPSSEVRFGAVAGRLRTVAADGRSLESWVPWDAESGPVSVVLEDGRRVDAPSPFFLTGGGDDALEPNSFDEAAPIDVPFNNPYLATRLTSMDHYELALEAPTALTVRVSDREPTGTWQQRLVVQLNRASGVEEFVGIAPAFAFERNERQDAVIARTSLDAGAYRLRIFVAPGTLAVDRRYEITVDTVADFQLPPDAAEPDDAPLEAPAVELPLSGRFTLENPWTTDYYAVDLSERSRVHVSAALGRSAGVFLIDGMESVTWQLSNGVRSSTYRGVVAPFGTHSFSCTLEPGRYFVGILDNSGTAGPYDLTIEAEPTDLTFLDCKTPTLGLREAEELRARPGGP